MTLSKQSFEQLAPGVFGWDSKCWFCNICLPVANVCFQFIFMVHLLFVLSASLLCSLPLVLGLVETANQEIKTCPCNVYPLYPTFI